MFTLSGQEKGTQGFTGGNNPVEASVGLSLFQRIIFASGSSRWSRSRPRLSDREVGVGFCPQKKRLAAACGKPNALLAPPKGGQILLSEA